MTEDKKPTVTVKQAQEEMKNDKSWKKEPWIGEDGFQYRRNRVLNADGSYTEFDVKVGKKPFVKKK